MAAYQSPAGQIIFIALASITALLIFIRLEEYDYQAAAAIASPRTRARYLPQWVSGASPEASPTA